MNNVTAGIIGGVAATLIATSAMVFATRGEKEEDKVAATRTECTQERVVTNKQWGANSVVGTVLGGAAGAAIGHQIGGGSGKDAATAAGAVGGAYVGNKVAREKYPDQEVSYREKCREVPAG